MKHPRIILLITAALLLTACADSADTTAETTAAVTADTAPATETESVDLAIAQVPADADFTGHTFTFLITGNTENNWQKNDFHAPE